VSWTDLRQSLPPPLGSWLAEVEADSLSLAGTLNEIANSNVWSFSLSPQERKALSPEPVAAFLEAVAQMWAERLCREAGGPWVFYAWYSDQAGALRFSLVPGRPGDALPFGAKVEIVDDPVSISTAFLSGSDVIPWAELEVSDWQPDSEPVVQSVLRVFTRHLHGMSIAAVDAIRQLVEDLVARRYSFIEADGRIGRLTKDDLTRAITEYGRTLVSLPNDAVDTADVYPLDNTPGGFAVDLPLWTVEEGRSDLTLSLTVVDGDDGPAVSIDDLHVL